ncbi:hypothetical protein [Flavobacterium sp. 25HG05S-40]|uniref:hypothetical protein n=1 Tax=Flavobacterium sp. 25HG05S-40 TaxID=3458682 RepID=UPI004044F777
MKFKIAVIIALTLSLISCKKEVEAKEPEKKVEKEVTDNLFRVGFNLIVKKDDNMHLYYTVDGSINFEEANSVWMPVKGNEQAQDVVFAIPDGIIPSKIRVDFGFGKNEAQSDVELQSFNLSYMGKDEAVKGQEIFKYFTPFEACTVVKPGTTILQRLKKDQAIGPILYPQLALPEIIKRVTSGGGSE